MDALLENEAARTSARVPRWLLIAGLLGGAAAAGIGLLAAPQRGLPPDAVARVNQHLIARDAWLRAVAAVAAERHTPLTDADQRHILDRLIDEELLVQHGAALGLTENDARLRSVMVSEVMLAATNSAPVVIDDAALRRYYDEHRDFFAPAAQMRVQAWRVDANGARAEFMPPIPDALLPLAKLEQYLGPALTRAAATLAPGAESAPLGVDRVVLRVIESIPAAAPPFEQVRDEVRAQVKRERDEAAVRELLAQLRASTPITVAPDLR